MQPNPDEIRLSDPALNPDGRVDTAVLQNRGADDAYLVGFEDSLDGDFQDLVIALRRTGDPDPIDRPQQRLRLTNLCDSERYHIDPVVQLPSETRPAFNHAGGKITPGFDATYDLERPWPAGRYVIHGYSYDGYRGRANPEAPPQKQEIWEIQFLDADEQPVSPVLETADLPDGGDRDEVLVEQDFDLGGPLTLTGRATKFRIRHHVGDPLSSGSNSVHAVCVGARPLDGQGALTILPVGDSVTVGCCSRTNSGNSYRYPLLQRLNRRGLVVDYVGFEQRSGYEGGKYLTERWDMDHAALIGARASTSHSWLKRRIDTGDLAAHDLDLALVHLGLNDGFVGELDGVHEGLVKLIAQIRRLDPEVTILLARPLRCEVGKCIEIRDELRTIINDVADEENNNPDVPRSRVVAVPIDEALAGYPLREVLAPDHHPTVKGDELQADVWETAIMDAIDRGYVTVE